LLFQAAAGAVFTAHFFFLGAFTGAGMNAVEVAFSLKNPKHIRLLFLPVATGWLIYNIVTFSIAGVLTEIFDLASLLIALLRFDILGKQKLVPDK
jgi:hypothetical protein